MTERFINLVSPLAHKATDMRIADTDGSRRDWSGAVSTLIGESLLGCDIDSENTTPRLVTPGIRTSATAASTAATSASSSAPEPSADQCAAPQPDFTFVELAQAYFDCRKSKRNSASALAFEQNLERNLGALFDELQRGTYRPGRSICFVITRPKPREVWAADFRDRIVHHLIYNRISPRFYASFIADSCACIPGRGTLYAAQRLESKIRSVTQNWSRPAWYLKLDLANFFVSIDKHVVHELVAKRVSEPWWLWLANLVLFHDPRQNYELRGNAALLERVPAHKRLTSQPANLGLPIGNLSSQFFANVYLDVLDQFVKHRIGARHYIRYVDDMVIIGESKEAAEEIGRAIVEKLAADGMTINPKKIRLAPVAAGVPFLGYVVWPNHISAGRYVRSRFLYRLRQHESGGYDRSESLQSYRAMFAHTGATR